MDLLEREPYMERLSTLVRQVTTGQGRTVLISGEAGIGKTALVEQFVRQHAHEVRALGGICDALFTPRPLGPLHDIAAQVRGPLATLLRQGTERSTLFSVFLEELHKRAVPTIVIFEDVHWADEATLDLLKFLGRRILSLPVLFVVTYRENELSQEHPLRSVLGDLPAPTVVHLRLLPLSRHAVASLARQAQRDADHLYTITGGNPFFVTEVLASETPGVPLTVCDAVFARMARLSSRALSLLELVSVVPARIERWLLETILEEPTDALEECLNSGMLSLEQTMVAFRHELARQAVESTLSPLRLRRLHTQVLQAMLSQGEDPSQAARLVHHAQGAHDEAMAARYGLLAARQAAAQGAHREAATHYATVLSTATPFSLEQQAELQEGRAYECYLTGQMEEAVQARQAALRIWQELGRSDQVGQTLRWLSHLSWFLGMSEQAHRYATEAVTLLETLPPGNKLARAYSNRAQLAMLADLTVEAVRWGEQAIALAESLGDIETMVHALNNVGATQLVAQNEQGRVLLERSLQLALEQGWEEHVARAYTNLASCAVTARDYLRAERYLREGIAYCLAHDLEVNGVYLRGCQARASFEQGQWDEAASEATRILGQHRLSVSIRIPALTVLGSIRVRRGDPESMSLLDEACELARATKEPQRIVPVAAARAEAAWLRGDRKRCLEEVHVGDHLHLADPWKRGELNIWRWRAGELKRASGPVAEPYALQIAGDWRGAAELWAHLGCPYEQALALAEGDVSAQREAMALCEQLGAQPALTLVRRRLRQQGITGVPRGPRLSTRANQAGLTSRQLEVLQLMAEEDLSYTEIASRLFTSLKTVEHHASAVLSKLGAHSRAQAVHIAFQMGLLMHKK